MILDCFPVADEQDLIEIRLAENYDTIDQYIIVESCYDQCGNAKPYNFEANIERYKPWMDKVTYYKIEDLAYLRYSFDWANEVYVRNCLINGIGKYREDKKIDLKWEDKILFGDCDEIVNNLVLKDALDSNQNLISFNHLFNCYKLNYYAPARDWFGSILTDYRTIYEMGSFQELRKIKDSIEHYQNDNCPSWHFSGVGEDSFEVNWKKWKTRIEPKEKIPDGLKEEYRKFFNQCVFKEGYFFYSDQVTRRDEDLKLQLLDKPKLPKHVIENWDRFSKLCFSYPSVPVREQTETQIELDI